MRETHEFATLDYLRGIAALAILVLHLRHELGANPLPFSYLAVDFFFVLSGFVLAHAYEQRLLADMTPAEFMRLRFVRLYPLYLIRIFYGSLSIGQSWSNFLGGFPRVGFAFFAGVLTYRFWRSSSWRPNSVPPWSFGVFLLLLWAMPVSWGQSCGYEFLAVLMFPVIIYGAASCEPSSHRSRSVFLWLGAISYALYVTHYPLIQLEWFLWPDQLGGDAPWAAIALALVAILLAALLSRIDPLLRNALNTLTAGAWLSVKSIRVRTTAQP